jgi:hypothetical protein
MQSLPVADLGRVRDLGDLIEVMEAYRRADGIRLTTSEQVASIKQLAGLAQRTAHTLKPYSEQWRDSTERRHKQGWRLKRSQPTLSVKRNLLWAYDNRCAFCQAHEVESDLEFAHLLSHDEALIMRDMDCVPNDERMRPYELSRTPENYVPACRLCNARQKTRSVSGEDAIGVWLEAKTWGADKRVVNEILHWLWRANKWRPA